MRLSWMQLRCRIGWHRWQWKSKTHVVEGTNDLIVFDFGRCLNPLCGFGHRWVTMNVERRPSFRARVGAQGSDGVSDE